MRKFRDKKVLGWKLIEATYTDRFTESLNDLMDKYDFIDCQFSTAIWGGTSVYTALILIAEKEPQS